MNIPYQTYVGYRRRNPEFGELADEAMIEGWERLEAATFEEAMKPSESGLPTGKLKEFLLKGRKRHVYGDRLSVQQEHRHEVRINLVPVLPAAAGAQAGRPGGEVVEGELVEDTTPESEES